MYFGELVVWRGIILTKEEIKNANDEKVGNYIYVVDKDGKTVSASDIRTGKSYTVQVPEGDEYSDEEEAGAAYWVNGYIKTIQIDEYTSRGDK